MHLSIPDPVTLNATIEHDFRDGHRMFVVLNFGDAELARWDVTDRKGELDEQPGDYWNDGDREQHERDWLSRFVAQKLAPLFAQIESDGK